VETAGASPMAVVSGKEASFKTVLSIRLLTNTDCSKIFFIAKKKYPTGIIFPREKKQVVDAAVLSRDKPEYFK
jgi:hypothetical protein